MTGAAQRKIASHNRYMLLLEHSVLQFRNSGG
jgi:hypothetical protein